MGPALSIAGHLGNRMLQSRPVGLAGRASGGVVRGIGRAAMTIPGAGFMLGLPIAAMTHDPTKNTFGNHMAREATKVAADVGFEMAAFGVAGVFGAPGLAVAGVASAAMYMTGVNPGAIMEHYMEGASRDYKKQMGLKSTPMAQNERTMRATSQALALLRQSRTNVAAGIGGRPSLLGQEAQFMHN